MLENRRALIDEYNAISDDNKPYKIQKFQWFTVTFHADGSQKNVPGKVEYALRNGEILAVADETHLQPELFERPSTHEHLHILS